jgi:hypothetical protein
MQRQTLDAINKKIWDLYNFIRTIIKPTKNARCHRACLEVA